MNLDIWIFCVLTRKATVIRPESGYFCSKCIGHHSRNWPSRSRGCQTASQIGRISNVVSTPNHSLKGLREAVSGPINNFIFPLLYALCTILHFLFYFCWVWPFAACLWCRRCSPNLFHPTAFFSVSWSLLTGVSDFLPNSSLCDQQCTRVRKAWPPYSYKYCLK